MIGSSNPVLAIIMVFVTIISSVVQLPLAGISKFDPANYDPDKIAEEKLEILFDYFDAIMKSEDLNLTLGGNDWEEESTEVYEESTTYYVEEYNSSDSVVMDFSSINNLLAFCINATTDPSILGGSFTDIDLSKLDNVTTDNTKAIDIVYAAIEALNDNKGLVSDAILGEFDYGKLTEFYPQIFGSNGLMFNLDLYSLIMSLIEAYPDDVVCDYSGEIRAPLELYHEYEEWEDECTHDESEHIYHTYYSINGYGEDTDDPDAPKKVYYYVPLTEAEKAQYNADSVIESMFSGLIEEVFSGTFLSEEMAKEFADSIKIATDDLATVTAFAVKNLIDSGPTGMLMHAIREIFAELYGTGLIEEEYYDEYYDEYWYEPKVIRSGDLHYSELKTEFKQNFNDGDFALFNFDYFDENEDLIGRAAESYYEGDELVFYLYENKIKGLNSDIFGFESNVRLGVKDNAYEYSGTEALSVDYYYDYNTGEEDRYVLTKGLFPASFKVSEDIINSLTEDDLILSGEIVYADGWYSGINYTEDTDIAEIYYKDGYYYTLNETGHWVAYSTSENADYINEFQNSFNAILGSIDPYFVFNAEKFDFLTEAEGLAGGLFENFNDILGTVVDIFLTDAAKTGINWTKGDNNKLNDNLLNVIKYAAKTFLTDDFTAAFTDTIDNLDEYSYYFDDLDIAERFIDYLDYSYFENVTLEKLAIDVVGELFLYPVLREMGLSTDIASLEEMAYILIVALTDETEDSQELKALFDSNNKLIRKDDAEWKELILDKLVILLLKAWAEDAEASGDVSVILSSDEIDFYVQEGWGYLELLDEIFDRFYVYIRGLVAVCDDLECELGVLDGNGPWYKMSKMLNALLPVAMFSNCEKTYGDETLPFDIGVFIEDILLGNILDLDIGGLLSVLAVNQTGANPFYGHNLIQSVLICFANFINAILPGTIEDEDIASFNHLIQNETIAKIVTQLITAINDRKEELVPLIMGWLDLAGLFEEIPLVSGDYLYLIGEDDDGEYAIFLDDLYIEGEYVYNEEYGYEEYCETLDVPEEINGLTVKGIDLYSYYNVDTINIHSNVKYVDFNSYQFNYIDEINIDEDNPYFVSDGKIIYSSDYKELLWYSRSNTAETLIVPGTVETFNTNILYENYAIKTVILTNGVKRITTSNTWYPAYYITDIYIPVTVTEIDDSALRGYDTVTIHGYTDSAAYDYYMKAKAEGDENYCFEIADDSEFFVTIETEEYTAQKTILVSGFASAGSTVNVYDGDKLIGSTTAAGNYKWSINVDLNKSDDNDSTHEIYCVASKASETATSDKITVKYSSDAIVFDSFTLSHSYSKVTITRANIDKTQQQISWVPGSSSSFKAEVINSEKLATLYLVSSYGNQKKQIEFTYVGNDTWVANGYFDKYNTSYTPNNLQLVGITKDGLETINIGTTLKIYFLIDPSGNVYEFSTKSPVENATATVYYLDEEENAVEWNAELYKQLNPITTDANGAFAWVVPKGMWQVKVTKDGYEDYTSEWMEVPPERTGLEYFLTTTTAPVVTDSYYKNGQVYIEFNQYVSEDTLQNYANYAFTNENAEITDILCNDTACNSYYDNSDCAKAVILKVNEYPGAITLNGIENYAGIKIAENTVVTPFNIGSAYTFTVEADKDYLNVGETVNITITATDENGNAVDIPVSVDLIADIFAEEIPEEITLADGSATLTLTAEMPGETRISFNAFGETHNVYVYSVVETCYHYYSVTTIHDATCKEDGYSYAYCDYCNHLNYQVIEKTGHTPVEIVNEDTLATEATCRTRATYYHSCEDCGKLLPNSTFRHGDMLNHVPGEEVYENLIEATETEDGSVDVVVYCTECQWVISRVTQVIKAGNSEEETTAPEETTTAPEETTAAPEETTTAPEETTIPSHKHSPAKAVVENSVPAGCDTEGYYDEVVYCSECNEELSRDKIYTDPTGHVDNDDDNQCDGCGSAIKKIGIFDKIKAFFNNIINFFKNLFKIG